VDNHHYQKAELKSRGIDADIPHKPWLPLDTIGQNELTAMLFKQLND
jgi:hypothetical protein